MEDVDYDIVQMNNAYILYQTKELQVDANSHLFTI